MLIQLLYLILWHPCFLQISKRKAVLEAVMSEAKGKLTVIAHVGCNNTADSVDKMDFLLSFFYNFQGFSNNIF